MVAASPPSTLDTTKSEETFAEAKVCVYVLGGRMCVVFKLLGLGSYMRVVGIGWKVTRVMWSRVRVYAVLERGGSVFVFMRRRRWLMLAGGGWARFAFGRGAAVHVEGFWVRLSRQHEVSLEEVPS